MFDATAWPVRPFLAFVLPLVDAAKQGCEFEVMQVLRSQSPLLAKEDLAGGEVAARLARLRLLTEELGGLLADGSAATNQQVLMLLRDSGIFALDPRNPPYLEAAPAAADADGAADDEGAAKEIAAMERFLACPAAQFWGYWQYVQEQSPFSTQQGIKGAEFPRVLVVLDDDEGTHTHSRTINISGSSRCRTAISRTSPRVAKQRSSALGDCSMSAALGP
ncbi:hypothetical protein [Brevundimonas nasdae]|uniref:hypothetical protein n=1 Tax=Brevundimonas nasdae TaxID=172043 RepID=UPI0028A2B9E2|nr:hypothetical protein [Brevundimonas nasdae]